jgi:hypothetical protein
MTSLRFLVLLAFLLLAGVGCGLSDYQSRMDVQRERVKEFDDANRSLDEPIVIPSIQLSTGPKKDKDGPKDDKEGINAWPFDFYLRLPKGYGATPKDKTPYFSPFPCFRYAANEADYDIFVAAAMAVDPKSKDKEEFGKYYPDNFRQFVRLAIKEFYFKTYKTELRLPAQDGYQMIEVKTLSPYSNVTTKIPYKYLAYADDYQKGKEPTMFRVYWYEESGAPREGGKDRDPGKQVAIIVHRPMRAQNEPFDKAIEACLGTLDVSSDAGNKRTQFRKTMKRT